MFYINPNRAEELKAKLVRSMECAQAAIDSVNKVLEAEGTASMEDLLQIPDRINYLIVNAQWAAEHALQLTTEPS